MKYVFIILFFLFSGSFLLAHENTEFSYSLNKAPETHVSQHGNHVWFNGPNGFTGKIVTSSDGFLVSYKNGITKEYQTSSGRMMHWNQDVLMELLPQLQGLLQHVHDHDIAIRTFRFDESSSPLSMTVLETQSATAAR